MRTSRVRWGHGLVVGVLAGLAVLTAGGSPAAAAPAAPNRDPNPAASTRTDGQLEVWRTLFDGTLVHQRRLPTGRWTVLEGLGGSLVSAPAAVTLPTGDTYVFGIGQDLAVWFRVRDGGTGGWSPWRSIGGRSRLAPGVDCAGEGTSSNANVYVVGTDGRLFLYSFNPAGRTWLPVSGRLVTAPGSVSGQGGVCGPGMDVLGVGTNGAVYEYRGRDWKALGGRTDVAPTAIHRPGGRVEAFVVGSDDALWTAVRPSATAAWSGWRKIGGGLTSAPAAQVSGSSKVVVARGRDGNLWQATSPVINGPWTWTRVPGSSIG